MKEEVKLANNTSVFVPIEQIAANMSYEHAVLISSFNGKVITLKDGIWEEETIK